MSQAPITVTGNLTGDPELTYTAGGTALAKFGVAVEHRYKSGDEWTSSTSFFNITCWRFLAEDVTRVLTKGTRVIVTGRLEQSTYTNKDGENRSSVQIIADEVGAHVGRLESITRQAKGAPALGADTPKAEPVAAATAPSEDPF